MQRSFMYCCYALLATHQALRCFAFVTWTTILFLLQIPEVCTAIGQYIINKMKCFWVCSERYVGMDQFTAFEKLAEATCNLVSSTCCSDALLDMLKSVLYSIHYQYSQPWFRPLNYLLRLHENQLKERQKHLMDMIHELFEDILVQFWGATRERASDTPIPIYWCSYSRVWTWDVRACYFYWMLLTGAPFTHWKL